MVMNNHFSDVDYFVKVFSENLNSIFRHPLYPLLVMLLKKCDEATQSIDVPSLESIDSEVRMYFQQQNDDWSPTLSDSDETNELVSIEIVRLVFHYFF